MIDSNKPSKAHWERNLRQYAHHAGPLFITLRSIEALRWVLFLRTIDVRGWELHLRDPESSGNQTECLSQLVAFSIRANPRRICPAGCRGVRMAQVQTCFVK